MACNINIMYVIVFLYKCTCRMLLLVRESHAVILRDRVVPASQVPFLGMGPDEPGQLCTEEMTAWDSFSHP